MIENSQKWYILDYYEWLICFPVFCVCFWMKYMLFLEAECLLFIPNLNIAQTCFMLENSQKWYILEYYEWLVSFPVFCLYFSCPKSIQICFFHNKPYQNPSAKAVFNQNIPIVIILIFLLQILCYSYSELPGNVQIYFRFF
jgi:hypothetical protein